MSTICEATIDKEGGGGGVCGLESHIRLQCACIWFPFWLGEQVKSKPADIT